VRSREGPFHHVIPAAEPADVTHATEDITDPGVFRLRVSAAPSAVVFGWDYPGSTLLRVRIQRSDQEFAAESLQGAVPDKHSGSQRVVYEGDTGSFHDVDVMPGETYFYTVWARPMVLEGAMPAKPAAGRKEEQPGVDEGGWVLWARKEVRAGSVPLLLRLRLALARLLGRG
jgi:hypothetical protein